MKIDSGPHRADTTEKDAAAGLRMMAREFRKNASHAKTPDAEKAFWGRAQICDGAANQIDALRLAHQEVVDDKHAWAKREVRAERECCAVIAEEWARRRDQLTDDDFVPGADHGERYAATGIAAAIRNRAK